MYPGIYPLLNPNETIQDIIDRAGGPSFNAYLIASKFIRNGIQVNLSLENIYKNNRDINSNFKVENGDRIIIAGHSKIISVTGEVNSPGRYRLVEKKNQ